MARKSPASSRNESSQRARRRAASATPRPDDAATTNENDGDTNASAGGDDERGERHAAPAENVGARTEPAAAGNPSRRAAPDPAALARMMTPDRAIELYKANAELALAVINAAIEGTSKLRRKQFEGEEAAREFQKRQVQTAAQARDPQSLVAAQQGATQEAMERSMRYWNEMFELIVEIQKRLFTLMQEQMESIPGMRETRAAMGMFPDLGEMQKVISAMQGVLSSGTSTFEAMQRAMAGFARQGQSRESGR